MYRVRLCAPDGYHFGGGECDFGGCEALQPPIVKDAQLRGRFDLDALRGPVISDRFVPSCPPSDPYADLAGPPSSWSVNTCSPARTVADQLLVMASLTL